MSLRPRRFAAVSVFLIFATIAIAAQLVSARAVHEQSNRLLEERSGEVGAQLTNTLASSEASLRSLATVARLPGPAQAFTAAATPLLLGQVRGLALVQAGDGHFVPIAAVGDEGVLPGVALTGERTALLQRALSTPQMVTAVLHDGYRRRLALAIGPLTARSNTIVYEESAVDPDNTSQAPSAPSFNELNLAFYAAPSARPDALIVDTQPGSPPLSGHVTHISVGADQWTLVVQPTSRLGGPFAPLVPWLLLIGGMVSAILAAAVVDVVLRRRDFALALVEERTSALRASLLELERTQAELQHQAFHDALTKLPNRALLLDRLEQALARARRRPAGTAVLFMDLDRFKWVNDSLGHPAGDRLIIAAAERLRSAVRPGDTVARLGGDEFVVLCEELSAEDNALALAGRIVASLNEPFDIDGHQIRVTASVGIAYADSPDSTPQGIVRDADLAMYQAKERGRDRIELFDKDMRSRAVARLATEAALRQAIDGHELRVHYQPVVNPTDGSVVGVEALVRWLDEQRGLAYPKEFIGLAEETGLIVPLGALVLDEACHQVARWNHEHRARQPLSVSVNLSARQLDSPGLADRVAAVLASSGLAPELLWIEITESVLMDETGPSLAALNALKSVGVTLVVDDFGTGYSSLLYVRRLPVDVLKIDQSFVAGLGYRQADDAIVASVIHLAHALNLVAVAEGVETAEQATRLTELGCEFAQGFFWSEPAAPEAMALWLRERWPEHADASGPLV